MHAEYNQVNISQVELSSHTHTQKISHAHPRRESDAGIPHVRVRWAESLLASWRFLSVWWTQKNTERSKFKLYQVQVYGANLKSNSQLIQEELFFYDASERGLMKTIISSDEISCSQVLCDFRAAEKNLQNGLARDCRRSQPFIASNQPPPQCPLAVGSQLLYDDNQRLCARAVAGRKV